MINFVFYDDHIACVNLVDALESKDPKVVDAIAVCRDGDDDPYLPISWTLVLEGIDQMDDHDSFLLKMYIASHFKRNADINVLLRTMNKKAPNLDSVYNVLYT